MNKPHLYVRCDKSLVAAVKAAAKADGRSVNQFVVRQLHKVLAEQTTTGDPVAA